MIWQYKYVVEAGFLCYNYIKVIKSTGGGSYA